MSQSIVILDVQSRAARALSAGLIARSGCVPAGLSVIDVEVLPGDGTSPSDLTRVRIVLDGRHVLGESFMSHGDVETRLKWAITISVKELSSFTSHARKPVYVHHAETWRFYCGGREQLSQLSLGDMMPGLSVSSNARVFPDHIYSHERTPADVIACAAPRESEWQTLAAICIENRVRMDHIRAAESFKCPAPSLDKRTHARSF